MNDLTDQQRWDRVDATWDMLDQLDAASGALAHCYRPDPPPPPAPLPAPVPIAWHVDIAAGLPNRHGALYFEIWDRWNVTTAREYFDTEAAALAFFAAAVEDLDRTPRPTMHYPNGGRAPFCRSVSLWELRRYASGRTGMYVKTLEFEEERHELTVHVDPLPDRHAPRRDNDGVYRPETDPVFCTL
jgi:hypothetical protein